MDFDSETPKEQTSAIRTYQGSAVKALGDNRIGGYAVMWGDDNTRDLYKEYFTPDTEFGFSEQSNPAIKSGIDLARPLPVFYHHALDDTLADKELGNWIKAKIDDVGLWLEAQLDLADEYQHAIFGMVKSGKLGLSSGALPQTVKIANDGKITHWKLIEVSLTPTPAEPRIMGTVTHLRALPISDPKPIEPLVNEATANDKPKLQTATLPVKSSKGIKMNLAVLRELLARYNVTLDDTQIEEFANALAMQLGEGETEVEISTAAAMTDEMKSNLEEAVKSLAAQIQSVKRQATVTAAKNVGANFASKLIGNAQPQSQVAGAYSPSNDVSVGEDLRYASSSTPDLIFAALAGQAFKSTPMTGVGHSVKQATANPDFQRTLAGRLADSAVNDSATRNAIKSVLRGGGAIKANEIMTSLASGGGSDFLGVLYSDQIWKRVRDEQIFDALVNRGMVQMDIPDGAGSVTVMLEGTDPTFYTVSQSSDADATGRPPVQVGLAPRPTTANVSFTPAMIASAVAYTDTLDLSSVINLLSQYSTQMQIAAGEMITSLFINGDTETAGNTNINIIDGTPGTGLTAPYYLAANGALKYALVTGSSTSRSAGTLGADDFLETLKLMPTAVQTKKNNLLFVMDTYTEHTALALLQNTTMDVRGANATLQTGILPNMYGIPSVATGFMLKANTSGKVSTSAGNNLYGRLALVYAPYWYFIKKRAFNLEVGRDPQTLSTLLVGSVYAGFKSRGAGSATASYNITV